MLKKFLFKRAAEMSYLSKLFKQSLVLLSSNKYFPALWKSKSCLWCLPMQKAITDQTHRALRIEKTIFGVGRSFLTSLQHVFAVDCVLPEQEFDEKCSRFRFSDMFARFWLWVFSINVRRDFWFI